MEIKIPATPPFNDAFDTDHYLYTYKGQLWLAVPMEQVHEMESKCPVTVR